MTEQERRTEQLQTLVLRARTAEEANEALAAENAALRRSLRAMNRQQSNAETERLRCANEVLLEQVRVLTLANHTLTGEV